MNEAPLLEVRNLSVSYRQGKVAIPALRDISFTLQAGDALGIIGESGSGKSTLAWAIMRYLGSNGGVDEGAILYHGRDLLQASDKEMRALRGDRLAMVYQQPQAALNPSIPLGKQIAEVFTTHRGVGEDEAGRRTLEMLERVHIHEPARVARLYPHQASGGMQQRVVIAMALATEPDLLLLDEPTTALDVTTQAAVLELLEELRKEFNTTLIFIAHDLAVITRIADRVAVFYAGEMVEHSSLRDLFHSPRHPYTRGLIDCLPARGGGQSRRPLIPIPGRLPSLTNLPPACVFEPRCRYAEADCTVIRPELKEEEDGHATRCLHWRHLIVNEARVPATDNGNELAAEPMPGSDAPALLELHGIAKTFHQGSAGAGLFKGPSQHNTKVLSAVTLQLARGETIGLVGESGSGKTTLARCVLGLTAADEGTITFGSRDLPLRLDRRGKDTLSELQMVFQNPDMSLNPRHTIRTILTRPIRLLERLGKREAEAAARDLLRAVNLDERYMDRFPSQLSGGEKQRVAIARAFATRTKLVICDEPVSGLDVSVQATVLNLLQGLQARWGTAYLFISHDLQVVQYLADRVVVLYKGYIVESGTTDQVYSGPNCPYTELLLASVPVPDPDTPTAHLALYSETKPEVLDGQGCPFKSRCHRHIGPICDQVFPPFQIVGPGHGVLCHIPIPELPRGAGLGTATIAPPDTVAAEGETRDT
jgi:peptide/nickel transport system ATP-binding protein